jgi:hypothetical protein
MRRKVALILAGAVGLVVGANSVTHAAFVDGFSDGVIANSDNNGNGFWTVGSIDGNSTNGDNASESGGALHLSVTTATNGTNDGPYVYSGLNSEFNFWAHPVSLALSAPTGGTLTPTGVTTTNGAWTYLGVNANAGGRMDSGSNRIFIQLSDQNLLQFIIKDSVSATTYNLARFAGASTIPADAAVTKMMLYLDGTNVAGGALKINFGAEYNSPSLGTGTYWSFNTTNQFDVGTTQGGAGGNRTQAQLNAVRSGYNTAGDTSLVMEVQHTGASDTTTINDVAIDSVSQSVVTPEPACVGLITACAALVARRRRR